MSDNASDDGTGVYLDRRVAEEPRLKLHRNATNIGLNGNLNLFARYLNADYYMILCSDDRLNAPDALRRALDLLERDPTLSSVYCDMTYIDAHGRTLAHRHFGRDGRFDAAAIARRSVVTLRNQFGIPLLVRRAAVAGLYYPPDLPYVGDVLVSAQVSGRSAATHIPQRLIANRYSRRNATWTMHVEARQEFVRLADILNIKLTTTDRIVQSLYRRATPAMKAAFRLYAALRARLY